MSRIRMTAIGIALVLIAGCGPDPEELAEDSTTDVLVPDDPRFADSFEFTLQEGPDNYSVRSNWYPNYNPEVDATLAITGFQIGDPTTWTGALDTETKAAQAAMVAVLTDSTAPDEGGPCEVTTDDPMVVSCSYDVGQADPLPLLVRRFTTDTGEVTMVILGGTEAAIDYLSGSFTPYPISEAADRWLVS
ncbi:MAG TPA: hypothetical protein VFL72_00945 [Acidimicrobiia bacterium]|nr:hypothetical protein [Acidimicrobiia bacterium]